MGIVRGARRDAEQFSRRACWTTRDGSANLAAMVKFGTGRVVAAALLAAVPSSMAQDTAPAADAGESGWRAGTIFEGWTGSVDVGLSGASGNTENFNVRGAIGAKKETPKSVQDLSVVYFRATDDGDETDDRWDVNYRYDYKLDAPRWRLFAKGRYEYDEFKDWLHRISLHGGVGYELVKTDKMFLLGRVGAGAYLEIGGEENAWQPEGLLGYDFDYVFTERQKVFATGDYFPSFNDLRQYRIVNKAGYELKVDPEVNMMLKAGVESEYDSSPGEGFNKHDFRYFLSLGWAF